MRRILLALVASLLAAPAASAAVAIDATFPVSTVKDNVTTTTTVSPTFSTSASPRLIFACMVGETPSGNLSNSIAWTSSTPSGATAFTLAVRGDYDDTFGDNQIANCWSSVATSNLTSVSVTHTNTAGSVAIVATLYVWSISGASGTIGATGVGPTTSVTGTVQVTVNATAANSLIIGVFGSANSATAETANAATTLDAASAMPTGGAWVSGGHATALTAGAGNVTIGTTTTQTFRMAAAVEVLAAGATTCVPSLTMLGVSGC